MNDLENKPFLPSKTEVKEIGSVLLFVLAHMGYHFCWLLPLLFLKFVPAGDQFVQVVSRLLLFSVSMIVLLQMMKYKRSIYRGLFGSIVSDQVLDQYAPVLNQPTNLKSAIQQNWYLMIVAGLMLAVLSGVIDFNNPWFKPERSTGKYGWINDLLRWIRGNPNTIQSLAWLYLVGSLGLFAIRIRRGGIHNP